MIINNSRHQHRDACLEKTYNWDELGLVENRTAIPLLIGSAFHAGIAAINTKQANSLDAAVAEAALEFRKRAGNWDEFLPEEVALYETEIAKASSMVRAYGEHYLNENYEMLAPEVKFCVPLPNSTHHCYYVHKLLHPEDPYTNFYNATGITGVDGPLAISAPVGLKCDDPRCYQPHFLSGTTDAIIMWNRLVWLQEHKTTAYDLYNESAQSRNWINDWMLNTQATCYIYGIWKSLGIRPHGVLLNAVIKPRSNAAIPTYKFYREAFLRSEAQLLQYETEIIRVATDYEYRMRTGEVWKNPKSCMNYNRKCEYWQNCISGERPQLGPFIQRNLDYVQLNYYKILGLEPPVDPTTVKEEVDVN